MRRAALLALVLCGCGGAPTWLDLAQQAHARADAALAGGDPASAHAALAAFVEVPAPASVSREDWRGVMQDVFARLAEIDVGLDPRAAVGWAARGLTLGERGDVFTANLFLARGHAEEKLGEDRAAAEDYHRVVLIDEALLNALGGAP